MARYAALSLVGARDWAARDSASRPFGLQLRASASDLPGAFTPHRAVLSLALLLQEIEQIQIATIVWGGFDHVLAF